MLGFTDFQVNVYPVQTMKIWVIGANWHRTGALRTIRLNEAPSRGAFIMHLGGWVTANYVRGERDLRTYADALY